MRRILITGATGFIGCRLAEVAVEQGFSVVGLVRTLSGASRLARLPVQIAPGDILDPDSVRTAMRGCDAVFHCAVDNRASGQAHRRFSVEGTNTVMRVASEMSVRRVIHLSSIAVFSFRPRPDASTEQGSYRYSGDAYCDGKIDAEKAALRHFREYGLSVTVLRPTIVYGPFGHWTTGTVSAIREGRMVLVNDGEGVCNTLYVDNLVDAMLLAAERDDLAGEVFHISDARSISWKEFVEAHARALGEGYLPLPRMSVQEIAAARTQRSRTPSSFHQILRLLRDPDIRTALRSIPAVNRSFQLGKTMAKALLPVPTQRRMRERILGGDGKGYPLTAAARIEHPLPPPDDVDIYAANVTVSVEKARRRLAYVPKISFAEGMEITADWIKWARL